MLYEFSQIMNKRYRIPTRQSRMDHPEKPASFGFTRHGRRKSKLSTRNNTKNSNMAPTKPQGVNISAREYFTPLYQKSWRLQNKAVFRVIFQSFTLSHLIQMREGLGSH
jgi:hypothetical protein